MIEGGKLPFDRPAVRSRRCVCSVLENIFSYGLERAWAVGYMKGFAIGYDERTTIVKVGREEPVASMDNSGKIIWVKHNEIQTVNIKNVGADYEVCDGERLPFGVKELGT
ncbi:hypothetical protein LXL04_003345 [Taraxacum kok-saghyz]